MCCPGSKMGELVGVPRSEGLDTVSGPDFLLGLLKNRVLQNSGVGLSILESFEISRRNEHPRRTDLHG